MNTNDALQMSASATSLATSATAIGELRTYATRRAS
jgi:hypothetical protein